MNEKDTVRLLRACKAEAKLGVASLTDTLRDAEDPRLRNLLAECRNEHARIARTANGLLDAYGDTGIAPPKMASGFGRLKTAVILNIRPSDATVAALAADGCTTGVRSLTRSLDRFEGASGPASRTAQDLITSQKQLAQQIRPYLKNGFE